MIRLCTLTAALLFLNACSSDYYYYDHGKKVRLTRLHETTTIGDKPVTWYKRPDGKRVGVRNELIVQCRKGVDCPKHLAKYHPKSVSPLSDTLWLIGTASQHRLFEIADQLRHDPDIRLAEPNLVRKKYLRR